MTVPTSLPTDPELIAITILLDLVIFPLAFALALLSVTATSVNSVFFGVRTILSLF